MSRTENYQAIVIGASAGGTSAISTLLAGLSGKIDLPLILVQHRAKDENSLMEENLQKKIDGRVKQVDEKEEIRNGFVYVAPPDYHLLIERNKTFSLTDDPPVNFSRPSIDVLFETASEVYREGLISIILTGSNNDGAEGTRSVFQLGGLTIAQDPREAPFPAMPNAAIKTGAVKKILTLSEINKLLIETIENEKEKDHQ